MEMGRGEQTVIRAKRVTVVCFRELVGLGASRFDELFLLFLHLMPDKLMPAFSSGLTN
jgi:hypothetical protein